MDRRRTAAETARLLLAAGAVRQRTDTPFILSSGWASPVYMDCRQLISHPTERRRIIELAVAAIRDEVGLDRLDAVAGGETAGIPFAAWVADRLDLPMFYVRKRPRGFGPDAQVEGGQVAGRRVLLVEDVATDSRSKVNFTGALRRAGARVDTVFVIFHFDLFAASRTALAAIGVQLVELATWPDVMAAAREAGTFPPAAVAEIEAFCADPPAWSAAHGGIARLPG